MSFPNFCKNLNDKEVESFWLSMLKDDNPEYIAKAVNDYVKNDKTGFAPSIGQIRTRASDIRRMEWEEKQRQQLPEPKTKKTSMPDWFREKWLNRLP
jgi:hypothetical protein